MLNPIVNSISFAFLEAKDWQNESKVAGNIRNLALFGDTVQFSGKTSLISLMEWLL